MAPTRRRSSGTDKPKRTVASFFRDLGTFGKDVYNKIKLTDRQKSILGETALNLVKSGYNAHTAKESIGKALAGTFRESVSKHGRELVDPSDTHTAKHLHELSPEHQAQLQEFAHSTARTGIKHLTNTLAQRREMHRAGTAGAGSPQQSRRVSTPRRDTAYFNSNISPSTSTSSFDVISRPSSSPPGSTFHTPTGSRRASAAELPV